MPEKLSVNNELSKQSYIYESAPTEYRDRHYKCSRCKEESVYTAEAQQEAYEIRKAYIWQTRELCINCYRARVNLEKSLVECRQLWQSEKNKILADSQLVIRHPHQRSEFLIRPDIFLERIAHEVNRKQCSARDSRQVASITSISLFAAS